MEVFRERGTRLSILGRFGRDNPRQVLPCHHPSLVLHHQATKVSTSALVLSMH